MARNIAAGNDRYREVVGAAVEIVRSDAASVQVFDPDRGGLRLTGWHGFEPASAEFWDLVVPESASTCGLEGLVYLRRVSHRHYEVVWR